MAKSKPTSKPGQAGGTSRAKPTRMLRIPEALAAALEGMADEQFNTLTEQAKIAIREYLEKNNRLPKPAK